jgi:signal transduction histidine kinase/DNA-binding NarL/FixJ family response regulator
MIVEKKRDTSLPNRCHNGSSAGACSHQVQFYDEEEYLHKVLSQYFAPFFTDGDSQLGGIVLARAQTTDYLADRLLMKGYTKDGIPDDAQQMARACNEGIVTPIGISIGTTYCRGYRKMLILDGDAIVADLVHEDQVNSDKFEELLKGLLSRLTRPEASPKSSKQSRHQKQPIYAYGELVDILCARGQHLLALKLESLWNRFLTGSGISLLCGYKLDSFRELQVEDIFEQICHSHAEVAPTEMYSKLATAEQKSAMIASLQRKAMTLQWSSGKAEQRMKNREQFVDTLCHELRNPVSGIVGNVELLEMGLDVRRAILRPHRTGQEDSQLSLADVQLLRNQLSVDSVSVRAIAACACYMKTVSDDVLNMSKLENGKVTLEKISFNPGDVILSVLDMFSTLAQKKQLQLTADLPIEKLLVLGDPGRLAQVVTNLVSNAIKFTDKGDISIQLCSLGSSLINGGALTFEVTVRDTGRGLSQDEVSILFQRFVQPSSMSCSKEEGSGLGLYISKCLVELMGGTMHVESQKGQGSAFTFTFAADQHPTVKDDISTPSSTISIPTRLRSPDTSESSTSSPSTSSSPSGPTPKQGTQHVLVVDDNCINVRVFTKILENVPGHSISVSTASNGYDAIGKLINLSISRSPVDVILMDLDMPFMDGLKTTFEIRNLGANTDRSVKDSVWVGTVSKTLAATPIIGLTADLREKRFAEAKQCGMNECIKKPIVRATLVDLIDKFAPPRMQCELSSTEETQESVNDGG